MKLKRRNKEQVLQDVELKFQRGYRVANAERVKSIASDCDDVEMLRALVNLACDELINPHSAPAHRKSLNIKTGTGSATEINLDEMPMLTKDETAIFMKRLLRDHKIVSDVIGALDRFNVEAAFREVGKANNVSASTVKKLYYEHFPKKP